MNYGSNQSNHSLLKLNLMNLLKLNLVILKILLLNILLPIFMLVTELGVQLEKVLRC
jgi:hypothetical protein